MKAKWPLLALGLGLALLLAACGGQTGGGAGNTGTVDTPGGQARVSLQGGTFTQGPTLQNVAPPQGFRAPYGAIAFTAQVSQGGTLTVTLTFPQAIPQGAVLQKYLNGAWQPVPGAQLSGNTATYQVRDGGPLDADGQANGRVVDPVALLTPSPDFTVSLDPTSLTVQQGSSGQTTLTLTPQNGFTGTVNLALVDGNGNPVSGITLSPTTVSVAGSNPVTQPLTVSVASGVAPGSYSLQVRATSGSLTKTANLSLTVTLPPDFTISLNPTSLTVQQGSSGQTTLTITPQNGFTGTVSLTLVAGQEQVPQGLTLSPESVQVSGANPVDRNLTLSAQAGTPTGTYRLKVRATSGSLTREADLAVTVSASSDGGGGGTNNLTPSELTQALQGAVGDVQQALSRLEQEWNQIFGIPGSTPQPAGLALQALKRPLDPMSYLQRPLPRAQELLGGILPQGLQDLPRGEIMCPYGSGCTTVGPSSDLEVRFQKPDGTWNRLFADWDYSSKGASSPTVYVHNPYDRQGQYLWEMPTKAFGSLDLGENGTNEGEATFQAAWRPSTCLSDKYLTEPENLSLTGFLQRPGGTGRLVDLPSLSLTTSASQLKLVWKLSLLTQGNDADLHTEGAIQINGSSTPGTCGSLLENFNASSGEVDVKLDTQNHTARLYFKITDWNENTGAVTIQDGYLTIDNKIVTFDGVLDDANGNCVPGDNLTLTFAGGQTMSLETYLIQQMGVSPCR